MRRRISPQLAVAIALLAVILLSNLLAPVIAPYDPNAIDMAARGH